MRSTRSFRRLAALALVVAAACSGKPVPAVEVDSYRFTSRVEIRAGRNVQEVVTQGQVRDRGPGETPDLLATVSSQDGRLEVLRLEVGAWTRPVGGAWQALDPKREGGTVKGVRLADIVNAIERTKTTEGPEGTKQIDGSIDASAVGIEGLGRVPVVARLDAGGRLVRLEYHATIAGEQPAKLDAVTEYSGFNDLLDWPAPPV